ncbi:MAG TPA: dual specificity protein phosphatase [Gemmataceae bacterium]|nr:dual specificity protein phosphatase [Gemmataceae bacterium]
MRIRWRRDWHILILAAVAVAATVALVVVHEITREPPNYSKIENGLWMGGRVAEPPPGTRAVLNLCDADDAYRVESYQWQSIRDSAPAPSLEWLAAQVDFVESERAAGRTVYVHCAAGASRSGMVVAAYLMKREGWTRDGTIEFLRSKRSVVNPNPAFMELLLEWEERVKQDRQKQRTSRQVEDREWAIT